ncbi:MAG TPA: HYR domain-containing protein [Bacteroidales bacterium]|nr:HYR domain-containing protein [Bacteroidales bacterium]HOL97837.1 HYR domain-containing protein [Bacteroidales bacterium]HOM35886.1 HYR domain-containing protein [Bacteroidales bacterium]HRS99199.1 HYR domain-containing protein [Bacteroidales bacterium]HUM32096.1 HYR domain-containing protein [Bacteroidales bacterium]
MPEIDVNLTITSQIAYYNGNTGEITVNATGGTPPFSYSLNGGPFQTSNVFSNLYPGIYTVVVMDSQGCTVSSTITINNASQIIANDDYGTINGYTGGIAVVNVLSNDLLNGNPVVTADIILTFISSTDPNVSLVGQDVVVALGTPAGTYYLVYQICEVANPTNCDQATVTITVIPPQIIANDDFASGINGSTGQNNVLNVFDNDLLNGDPVDPAEVSLTLTVPDPTNTLTLNPDGSVDVAPFTPGGTYTLTYQICEILNPTNCDDAIVTIVVINTSDISIVKSHIDPSNLPVGNPSQLIQINPSVITAGTMIYYFLNVQNLGPNNSQQATITDITPPGILNPEYSLNFGNSWFSWDGTRYLNEFLYPGANYILIRGLVDPSATGTLVNTATIYSAVTPDPDLSNNESTVITTILTSADLQISKIALTSPVTIGGQITYQISVTNYGPSNANNVTITDVIDPTIISTAEYSIDGGINWLSPWTGSLNIGTLAYNSTFVLLIRGTVIDASPNPNVDPIPNTASVTSSDPDPNPGNNEETIFTPLNVEADVSIIKTGPATIVAGTQIQYSIVVTNNSNTFDALNVNVHDNISPLIIDNPEFSIDGGLTWNPWTGVYVIGDMNPLESVTILVRGNVLSNVTGNIVNTAYIETDTPDPDVTNNTSTVNTTVEIVSDLYIYKVQIDPSILPLSNSQIFGNPNDIVIDPVTITAGETIYYAILYGNNGPSDATNVIIQDILPGVVVDWESSRCQANYGTWTGVGNLGTIIAGGGCVLIIRGDVLPDATGSIVNTAIIYSNDVTDPDPDNNESTFVTPIQGMSDLSVQKTVDNNTPYVGDQVTFTITIINNGPSQATNITVTDQLPTGYTYVSHTVSDGNYDNVSGIWTISTINYPGSAVLTITAIVDLPGGSYTNVATITNFDQYDPNPNDNTDTETTSPINVIIANDDNGGPINGYTGAVNILNVFDNDLLNGSSVNPADLILSEVTPDPTGNLTLNPDGSVDLAPNTPAGTYTLTYQICEIINTSNCDDAIVTVTVIMPSIIANDDTFTAVNFDCVNGGIVGNVLNNDYYNGNPADPSSVTITLTDDGGISGASIFANGNLFIPAGTVVGTYNLSYQICDVINPTNCDDANIVVIIQDFIPPTIVCPDNILVNTDTDDCQSTNVVIIPPTVNDNCGILSVSGIRSDLLTLTDPYPVGTTTITWTVTDFGGNTATCEQTVTVIDNQLPHITCPAPVVAYTDPDECFASGVVLGFPVVDDNCGILSVTNDAPTTFTVGNTIVTWTVTDVNGNIATCQQIVTVYDNQLPSIICPDPILSYSDNGFCHSENIALITPLVSDNCSILFIAHDAPEIFPVGTTIITWTVSDVNGNTSTCQQTITVIDNQLPDITCPAPVVAYTDPDECFVSGVVLGSPVVDDNCGILSVTNNAPTTFPVGNTIVTWTVTDMNGNTATCEQTVTVIDNQLPDITCPAPVVEYTDPDECFVSGVVLGSPVVDDNCGILSVTNNAPTTFPVGNTIVTWTVTDMNGNTATCEQTVTVIDNQLPDITCPAPVVAYTDPDECFASGIVLGSPVVDDNCGILSVTNNAPTTFPVGNTIVTWTVTDMNGNTATCEQTVTVIDNQLPTIICPEDIYTCSETIELIEPQVLDNCGIDSITNNAPDIFPVGTTIVIWTVTDVNGNVNTCEQAINVSMLEVFAEITSVPSCNGTNDAEITITVSGNFGDLTYSIDGVNTQTSNVFSGLGSGTYYITTTDITGCEIVYGPVEIQDPIILTATVNIISDVLCYGSNEGAIEIIASGGTGEYTYYINGSLVEQSNISGLNAGDYNILVVDSNNCETEISGIIITQPEILSVNYIATESVDCYGDNTASVEVSITGGSGDYMVTLTDIFTGNLYQSSTDYVFDNLFAGTYKINVTDANNCSYQTELSIGSPAPLVLNYSSYCEAGIVGIEILASGGNGGYLYSIDGGQNWSEDPHFSNLTNDTNIYLTVKDAKGCYSAIIEVPVLSLNTLNASVEIISSNSCYGVADAEIMINVEGGVMPYIFIINGEEIHYSEIISNIHAGNHVIEIRDSNGCPAKTEVTIESSEEIRIDLISKTDADCTGNANGAAQLDVHGGAGNFFYNWTNGATTPNVNNLAVGVHTVTVTDLKGCTVTYDINIETDFIGEEIVINNVFTPNNDGLNDYFTIKNIELYPENELVILNRWGNEVFTKTSYDNTWDGSNLTEGTYFYILKVKMCNEEEIIKGYITILR